MKFVLALVCVGFWAQAYVPNTRMILQRTVENSGTGAYQVEKEVKFSNPEIPTLREIWQLENERTLRLTVIPVGVKSAAKMTILYAGGQKHLVVGGKKEVGRIPSENSERMFHFRSTDNFIQYLNNLGVINGNSGNLDLARLNRSQGVVNFGLGRPTEAGSDSTAPYIWIEQDRFVIRKLRLESKAEIMADQFQTYAKGLIYPDLISVSWNDQKVRMNTLSVSLKKFTPQTFQASQLEDSQEFNNLFSKWSAVSEFYKRFR